MRHSMAARGIKSGKKLTAAPKKAVSELKTKKYINKHKFPRAFKRKDMLEIIIDGKRRNIYKKTYSAKNEFKYGNDEDFYDDNGFEPLWGSRGYRAKDGLGDYPHVYVHKDKQLVEIVYKNRVEGYKLYVEDEDHELKTEKDYHFFYHGNLYQELRDNRIVDSNANPEFFKT